MPPPILYPFPRRRYAPASPGYGDLWQALVAWVGSQTAATLTGGLSAYRDPEGCVLPYAVYAKVPATKGYDSGGSIDSGEFTVTSYAADLVTANALAAQLAVGPMPVLKDPPLVFANGTLLYLRASSVEDGDLDPDPGPNGEDVYSSIVTCSYLIDRDT